MSGFKVAEKFISINGEGKRAGQMSAFVRFANCNLRCSYCDTKWAQDEKNCSYTEMSAGEITDFVKLSGVKCCTLTGGEPLFREDFDVLLHSLFKIRDLRVEIETNGSVFIGDICKELNEKERENLSFMLDYKLPSSGMEKYMLTENYDFLRETDSVKFVCGGKPDLERALEIIRRFSLSDKCVTFFSPVFGQIEPKEIVEFIIENNLYSSRFQLQLHKFVWDPDMKGV